MEKMSPEGSENVIKKKAIIAGSIGLDIIPVFPEKKVENNADLFAQGKFNDMCGTRLYLGGCVGNTGIAMHKLGVPVMLHSKVGEDFIGSVIRKILTEQNIPIELKTCCDESSTSTVVVAPFGGDRVLLHSRGASQTYVAADIDERILSEADHIHFGYPTAMKYLYANDGSEFISMLQRFKKLGLTVSVDTSQPDPRSEAGTANWKKILTDALPHIDIFMPSLEEVMFMLRRDEFERRNKLRGSNNFIDYVTLSDIIQIGEELLSLGARIVLLKIGKMGLYLKTAEREKLAQIGKATPKELSAWSDRTLLCPAYSSSAIRSTTGAGDNAIAGFLASFLRDDAPEKALLLASANAKRCIESYETTAEVIPLAQLDSFIDGNPAQERINFDDEQQWMLLNGYNVYCKKEK